MSQTSCMMKEVYGTIHRARFATLATLMLMQDLTEFLVRASVVIATELKSEILYI